MGPHFSVIPILAGKNAEKGEKEYETFHWTCKERIINEEIYILNTRRKQVHVGLLVSYSKCFIMYIFSVVNVQSLAWMLQ